MQRGKNETLEEMELAMHCHLKPPAAPVMLGFNCDSRDTSTTAYKFNNSATLWTVIY